MRFSYYGKIENPLYEALQALCGAEPPAYTKGCFAANELPDQLITELQDWCSLHARPEWATGLSMLECAEQIVADAVDNANILPSGS